MITEFVYTHRNGETVAPELAENDWTYYWFDGVAHYENWTGRGDLTVVTGTGADRVVGLVIVAMMIDMKRPKREANGRPIHSRATMIAEVETTGYDLEKCEGKWFGPVYVPKLSDDIMSSWAAVMDYETWKQAFGNEEPTP